MQSNTSHLQVPIDEDGIEQEVKQRFKALALRHHPDKHAEELFVTQGAGWDPKEICSSACGSLWAHGGLIIVYLKLIPPRENSLNDIAAWHSFPVH